MANLRVVVTLLFLGTAPWPAYAQCRPSEPLDPALALSSELDQPLRAGEAPARDPSSMSLGGDSCLSVQFGWSVGGALGWGGEPERAAPGPAGLSDADAPDWAHGEGLPGLAPDPARPAREITQRLRLDGLSLRTRLTPGSWSGAEGPEGFAVGGTTRLPGGEGLRIGVHHAFERSAGEDGEQAVERATGLSLGLGPFTASVAKHELWGDAGGLGKAYSGRLATALSGEGGLPDRIELRALSLNRADGSQSRTGLRAGWNTAVGALGFDVHLQRGDDRLWGFGASWSAVRLSDWPLDMRATAEVDGAGDDAHLSFGGRLEF